MSICASHCNSKTIHDYSTFPCNQVHTLHKFLPFTLYPDHWPDHWPIQSFTEFGCLQRSLHLNRWKPCHFMSFSHLRKIFSHGLDPIIPVGGSDRRFLTQSVAVCRRIGAEKKNSEAMTFNRMKFESFRFMKMENTIRNMSILSIKGQYHKYIDNIYIYIYIIYVWALHHFP